VAIVLRSLFAPRLWCAAIGLFIGCQGAWAFVAPRSFFDALATFEPFNAHFVRDIGTIQIGVGVGGIVGGLRVPGVVAGLAGLLAFQVLHVTSHVIDRDAGGRPGFDIPALAVVAVLTAVALTFALRSTKGNTSPPG
jgi:hypothetical protein